MTNFPRRYLWILPALFLAPGAVRAQSPGSGLSLEVNRYYGERDRALVEGAVEIPYPLLTFVQDGDALRAHARVEVAVERADGERVYHTEHEIKPEAANAAMAASDRVSSIETFAIYAPPGEYVTRARVTDLQNQRSFELTSPLTVPQSRPLFSDALLSNRVQKNVRLQEGTYLPYLIGTTMFNPNPRKHFSKDAPLVYFYYEVSPDAAGAESGETIALRMTIRDASGEVIKDLGERAITASEGRNFDTGAFNIVGLPDGAYRFVVDCPECAGNQALSSEFRVLPSAGRLAFLDPPPVTPAAASTPSLYAGLSAAQVDSVIGVLDLFFTPSQNQLLSTLNAEGKVQFLNRWWESMDPNPETPVNEAKEVIEQRVAFSDQNFTSSQRTGRDTDRGMIYMLFGSPTERIDRPVEATLGPYVIWNYSNEGQTFAFGDFRRDGDYRLIYSTDSRFPGDPSIQSQVDQLGGQSESFLPGGRGYERIIEDIRQNRTSRGFQ
ncbi:MAG TPA: GWxTD domain-containing protein [Gemmatimonadota bacterium]|nr:GWxTD domain-containing protein [Gemmatimonadota bacterium]